jgi:leucyl-tRNA synthetase
MDLKKMEQKWQDQWEKKKVFESNPDKRKSYFITFPFPYVNGAPHVGHSFSAFRTDVYARYKRMNGFNVLYPQGFHATGEPILGVIERLRKNDQVQIDTMKVFGASSSDIKNFIKKGPEYAVHYWRKKWITHLKKSGFSIDWRRSFVTTSLNPQFSRFIEWQYNTLRKMGYVVQGTHPVIWCSKCQSPTGDHDRLEGEGESPIDYIIIKFEMEDGSILPAATLRPETIYGVVNMWINPGTTYVLLDTGAEKWIVSKKAAKKLKDQLKDINVIKEFTGDELCGKKCIEPVTRKTIPILPASFVDQDSATGVVMSVPSHAPYDWIALKELVDNDQLKDYGLSKNDVEPVSIIETPELVEHPAIEICKRMNIKSLRQVNELDDATKIIYKKEFHQGKLKEGCGEYSGLKVSECKEKLYLDFINRNVADIIWECAGVVCRCTTKCHVKILENQWFLKFSDELWKDKARRCVNKMIVYPEDARTNFLNTIEWLKDKACVRKTGLGTQLPWDRQWIVETLSDSTIYMAYYTIAKTINENKIPAKRLTDEVFDFIFLNKGDIRHVSKASRISTNLLKEMKEEFQYYYPVDIRTSGKDLIQNHLTFFIFHHVAMWQPDYWPQGIGVNGFVNIEGEKMSKSRGNVYPLIKLVKSYGSDIVRLNIVSANENLDDADWRSENIKGIRSRLEFLYDISKNLKNAKSGKINSLDLYLQSMIQRCVEDATENFEKMKFRAATQHALYDATNVLKWYLRRFDGIEKANRKILTDNFITVIKMLAPLMPHLCEEMWKNIGRKPFISNESWPKIEKFAINVEAELGESIVKKIMEDSEEIIRIIKIKNPNFRAQKIFVFVAEDWKFKLYQKILKSRDRDIKDVMNEILNSDMKVYGNATVLMIQGLYKNLNELQPALPRSRQFELLNDSRKFLEKELGCGIEIVDSDKTQNQKAKASMPHKLGILIE